MPAKPSAKLKSVYSALLKRIKDGDWEVGELIAPAGELAKDYECSIGMMSKALAMLSHEGLVEQRPRVGTRIIGTPGQAGEQSGTSLKLDAFAFIHPSDLHEGGWKMLTAFQKAATRAGRRTVVLSTGADFQKEMEMLRRLDEFDVQAAAIFPFLVTPEDHIQFSQLIVSVNFPMVLIDHCPAGVECLSVHMDCFHAGYTMTRRLIDQGARRIGFLTNNGLRLSGRNRYQGFLWAMQEAGIEPIDELILVESASHPNFEDPFAEPTRVSERYLKQAYEKGIDAVVCSNDVMAIGLMRAAQKAGIAVPADFKVVGTDNLALSASEEFSLTSYDPPYAKLGEQTFDLLNVVVEGKPAPRREYSLRGELIVRSSG